MPDERTDRAHLERRRGIQVGQERRAAARRASSCRRRAVRAGRCGARRRRRPAWPPPHPDCRSRRRDRRPRRRGIGERDRHQRLDRLGLELGAVPDRGVAQSDVIGTTRSSGHERRLGALPVGTSTVPNPARAAASTAGRMPVTGRSRPSSPSSPRCTTLRDRRRPRPCRRPRGGHRDAEVESRAVLRQRRRREVDRQLARRAAACRRWRPPRARDRVPRRARHPGARSARSAGSCDEMSASISTTAPSRPSRAMECARPIGIRRPVPDARPSPERHAGRPRRPRRCGCGPSPDAPRTTRAARRRSRASLTDRDRLERMPVRDARPRLHLDEHGLVAVAQHEVDLALRAPPVAVDDRHPAGDEVPLRDALTALSESILRCHGSRMPGRSDDARRSTTWRSVDELSRLDRRRRATRPRPTRRARVPSAARGPCRRGPRR